jgi:hypothetical protein
MTDDMLCIYMLHNPVTTFNSCVCLQAAAGAVAVGGIWYYCHSRGLSGGEGGMGGSVFPAPPRLLGATGTASTTTSNMAALRDGGSSLRLAWSPDSAARDLCRGI